MKSSLKKALDSLKEENLTQLFSFIEEEDLEFINEKGYTKEEMLQRAYDFFEGKNDQTVKLISQDLHKFNVTLHDMLFAKKEVVSQTNRRSGNQSKQNSLTPNQTLVMNRINKIFEKNNIDKVRTDNIDIRGKSKFFLGGVLTTLVERKLVAIEIIDKKKYVVLVK